MRGELNTPQCPKQCPCYLASFDQVFLTILGNNMQPLWYLVHIVLCECSTGRTVPFLGHVLTKWESQSLLSEWTLSVVSALCSTFCSCFLFVGWLLLLFGESGKEYPFVIVLGMVFTMKEPDLGRAVVPQPLLLKYVDPHPSHSPEPSKLTSLCLNKGSVRPLSPLFLTPNPSAALFLRWEMSSYNQGW